MCNKYVINYSRAWSIYIISGKGMYNLDNNWYMVQKDDYIFMASYCIQGGYGAGKDDFIYLFKRL